MRRLYKSRYDVKIDGVCAGFARYMNLDVTLVRLVWALGSLFFGMPILFYVVCAVIMPREPMADLNKF